MTTLEYKQAVVQLIEKMSADANYTPTQEEMRMLEYAAEQRLVEGLDLGRNMNGDVIGGRRFTVRPKLPEFLAFQESVEREKADNDQKKAIKIPRWFGELSKDYLGRLVGAIGLSVTIVAFMYPSFFPGLGRALLRILKYFFF